VDAGVATEVELVDRIASHRDRAAEAELCRRFAPRVRLYGLRHLGTEDRARDLVQAVMLAVLEATRAGRVEDPARIDRFVLGTCRHIATRARARDAVVSPSTSAEDEAHAPMPEVDRVDLLALTRCLDGLADRARSVVILSFCEGRDADEIASILATTSGNVRVVRHRAVAALRECLDTPRGGES
jgi:RNA polymerase sigma-70 factor (ECF subfamily)